MNDRGTHQSTAAPEPPALNYVGTFEVDVDKPITVGTTVDGVRRVVPILGGRVFGPEISGRVLNAGADFQQYPSEGVAYLVANYVLELDDGHHILVENRALRTGAPEDLRRVMEGETVDPAKIYFRCSPRLTADESGPYAWMNKALFIGTGERHPYGVRIEVFKVG